MSADKSHQIVIREAIRKIALGRSMERINMAPGGMSGVGTARMIHGYVAKVHDDPADIVLLKNRFFFYFLILYGIESCCRYPPTPKFVVTSSTR